MTEILNDQTAASADHSDYVNHEIYATAIEQLIDQLAIEIDLIKNNEIDKIGEVFIEKNKLVDFIQGNTARIMNSDNFFGDDPSTAKAKLISLAQELQDITNINKEKLSREIYYKQEVIKVISNVIKEQVDKLSGYNSHGKINDNNLKNDPPSISMNDQI